MAQKILVKSNFYIQFESINKEELAPGNLLQQPLTIGEVGLQKNTKYSLNKNNIRAPSTQWLPATIPGKIECL